MKSLFRLLVLLLVVILLGCSATTKVKYNEPEFTISLKSKVFLDDLKNDIRCNCNEEYTPSIELINKYKLVSIYNKYYFSGTIETNDNFTCNDIPSNVLLSSENGFTKTVIVPVVYFNDFMKSKNINHLKISTEIQS